MTTPRQLDYRTPEIKPPAQVGSFYVYLFSTVGGAVLVAIAEFMLDSLSPIPSPDDLGIGILGALIIWGIFISMASLIIATIFRLFSGRAPLGQKLGMIAFAGALNGLVGLGAFIACGEMEDRHVDVSFLPDHWTWNIVIAINIALPILLGIWAKKRFAENE